LISLEPRKGLQFYSFVALIGRFPVGKVKAGYYRLRFTVVPLSGKRAASLSSPRFYLNAKHRIVPSKTKVPGKKKE
jgi:hypothetical protein